MTFERKKYKNFALMQLNGRWKPAIIGTLISLLIALAFTVTQKETSSISYSELLNYDYAQLLDYYRNSSEFSAPSFILSFIQTIVGFITEIVLISFLLIFSRSPDPVSLKSYFECYNKWGRGILTGLWRWLWLFLWGLIAVPILIGLILLYTVLPVSISDSTIGALTPIVLLICLIPMFIKSIEYSFVFFFVSEFSEIGIRKALRLSITIAKGHRWNIFVLDLSFIGWFLLCAISLGIGFLWILPYYYLTLTNTYHALLQDALESGKIKPEDLNS